MTLAYDAENRMVEVKKNNVTLAQFTYNGDGQRVKSVVNGETTLFVGGYYEILNPGPGQTVTKYYPGGAMRKYVIPQSMSVEYALGDHLGSASVMTDSLGNKVSEMRYTPWGEVRYSWTDPSLNTTPAYELPKYSFTGQYSYVEEFGLMFYNARFYDPAIGRFAGADSVVPNGVQGYDRFAYANNNPTNYTDISGHKACRDYDDNGNCIVEPPTIVVLICGRDYTPGVTLRCADGDGSYLESYKQWAKDQGYRVKVFSVDECLEDNDAAKAECASQVNEYVDEHEGEFILVGHSAGADVAILAADRMISSGQKGSLIGVIALDPTLSATDGCGNNGYCYEDFPTTGSMQGIMRGIAKANVPIFVGNGPGNNPEVSAYLGGFSNPRYHYVEYSALDLGFPSVTSENAPAIHQAISVDLTVLTVATACIFSYCP